MTDVPVGTLCFAYFGLRAIRASIDRHECLIWLGDGKFLTLHGIVKVYGSFWVAWWQ